MKKKIFFYVQRYVPWYWQWGVGCSQQSGSSESGTSSNTSNVQSETGSQTQNADLPVTSGQGESGTASDSKNVTATFI